MFTGSLLGTTLADRYEILSELGSGRVGVVYKAKHRQLERQVAIKVLHEGVGHEGSSFLRFQREAKNASRLNHPNIITVFDFGLSEEQYPYLVMEFVEGQDLHSVLAMDGTIPLPRAVRIMLQMCSALAHAHKRGVVHRDIKPSNIMLMDVEDSPDFVKIVDFGIAKQYGEDVREDTIERLTMEGQVLGTPAYMSPEQCQGRPLDPRADVYSLGCVLYKMLTGQAPIGGNDLMEILQGHINKKPLRFADVAGAPELPMEIEGVVMRALAKEPEDRYQSMSELRLHLRSAYTLVAKGQPYGLLMYGNDAYDEKPAGRPEDIKKLEEENAQRLEVEILIKRAMDGDRDSFFALYKLAKDDKSKDPMEAFGYLLEAAERNHVEAQLLAGQSYLNGDGVTQDFPKAIHWFERCVVHRNLQAILLLAACLKNGLGGAPDPARAVHYIQQAVELNDVDSKALLACCLLCGDGVQRNIARGIIMLKDAAMAGNSYAQWRLALCCKSGIGIMKDQREAEKWFGHSSDGRFYQGMPWDLKAPELSFQEAVKSFQSLAAFDHKMSYYWLGICYEDGTGVKQDLAKAFECYQRAAAKGVEQAIIAINRMRTEQTV